MLIYGAGGHGAVLLEACHAAGIPVLGVFDDGRVEAGPLYGGVPLLGPYLYTVLPGEPLVLAIGDNALREQLARKISHAWGMVVHPLAYVSPSATVGAGTVVFALAAIQARAVVGNHVIINTGAVVEHDCSIASFVHIAPGAVVCGGAVLESGVLIGPGAVVEKGIRVGANALVAAGAVVVQDVPPFSIIKGVPGKIG